MESNIGWVESYIDPENIRATFDGWVALVADNGNEWTFKSINIRKTNFDPSNAPDFRK